MGRQEIAAFVPEEAFTSFNFGYKQTEFLHVKNTWQNVKTNFYNESYPSNHWRHPNKRNWKESGSLFPQVLVNWEIPIFNVIADIEFENSNIWLSNFKTRTVKSNNIAKDKIKKIKNIVKIVTNNIKQSRISIGSQTQTFVVTNWLHHLLLVIQEIWFRNIPSQFNSCHDWKKCRPRGVHVSVEPVLLPW